MKTSHIMSILNILTDLCAIKQKHFFEGIVCNVSVVKEFGRT